MDWYATMSTSQLRTLLFSLPHGLPLFERRRRQVEVAYFNRTKRRSWSHQKVNV